MAARTSIRPTPEDFQSFAIGSIERVIDVARAVQKELGSSSQFCRTLCCFLSTIKSHLQNQDQAQGEEQNKIESLLNNLERLCSVRVGLCTLAHRLRRTAEVFLMSSRVTQGRRLSKGDGKKSTNCWPTLKALQHPARQGVVIKCLRKFVEDIKNSDAQDDLLKKLKNFIRKRLNEEIAHATATQTSGSSSRNIVQPRSHELDDDVQYLYNTLLQYHSCELGESFSEIKTNIRLNGYKSIVTDDVSDNATAEFGVLFYDHPHSEECYWQEACIQICHSTSKKARKIQLPGDEPQPLPQSQAIQISYPDFCDEITIRNQSKLLLLAQNGKFSLKSHCRTSRNWLSRERGLSLERLLDPSFRKGKLTEKMKVNLAVLLARATWQFYDSDLIGQGLTKENVYFLFEERDSINAVFINEPMLLISFKETETNLETSIDPMRSRSTKSRLIHDMPKILALGILLIELETEITIEEHRRQVLGPNEHPANANSDYNVANRLIELPTEGKRNRHCILSEMSTISPLRKILPLCIKEGELRRMLREELIAQKKTSSASNLNDGSALRAIIYSDIVKPLEDSWSNFELRDVQKPLHELVQMSTQAMPPIAHHVPPLTSQPAPQPSIVLQNNQEDELRQKSKDWFAEYEVLKYVLQPEESEMGAGYEPVKIAMLDTGINVEGYEWCQAYIKEYKDFTDADHRQDTADNTGHGTAGVFLLLKTCPNANLYLARVLKENTAKNTDVDTVVKAINWAIEHKVHIITMALGFKKYQHEIAEAITRAYGNGILIFSAASNGQNFEDIYFPANRTDLVFGIFSTNASISNSESLNPSPEGQQHSLAIFGENVENFREDYPLLRGTSFATSIAAGLAALLLDFSRQKVETTSTSRISRLKEMHVMLKVFKEMAVRDKYDLIRPWKLLKDDDTPARDYPREAQRDWIRGTIERLL